MRARGGSSRWLRLAGMVAIAACTSAAWLVPAVSTPAGATIVPAPTGYRLLGADGGVFSFGSPFEGSASSNPANCHIIPPGPSLPQGSCAAIAATPDDGGYYVLNRFNGSIFTFGDAVSYGQPAGSAPYTGSSEFWPAAVAMAVTPTGLGYWVLEVGASGLGSVQAFGDAANFGDEVSAHVAHNGVPVGIVSSSDGKGYLIADSDGGVFAFGDAVFSGSMGGTHMNAPVVGIGRNAPGGYWLVGADGGVFSFGDAPFGGSLGSLRLNAPIVGIVPNAAGAGYWLVAADGGVFAMGQAPFFGSMGGQPLAAPVVAAST